MNINIDHTVPIDKQLVIGIGRRIFLRRQLGNFNLNAGLNLYVPHITNKKI